MSDCAKLMELELQKKTNKKYWKKKSYVHFSNLHFSGPTLYWKVLFPQQNCWWNLICYHNCTNVWFDNQLRSFIKNSNNLKRLNDISITVWKVYKWMKIKRKYLWKCCLIFLHFNYSVLSHCNHRKTKIHLIFSTFSVITSLFCDVCVHCSIKPLQSLFSFSFCFS